MIDVEVVSPLMDVEVVSPLMDVEVVSPLMDVEVVSSPNFESVVTVESDVAADDGSSTTPPVSAHATPTSNKAVATAVNIPSTFLAISELLDPDQHDSVNVIGASAQPQERIKGTPSGPSLRRACTATHAGPGSVDPDPR